MPSATQTKEHVHDRISLRVFVESIEKAEGEGDASYVLTAAIASDGSKDRYGETVNPNGWELKNFKQNPVLLLGHDYHALPVGRVNKIAVKDDKLSFSAEFAPTAEAQDVAKLYQAGFMKAFSVGFLPTKFGPSFWGYSFLDAVEQDPTSKFTYQEQELLEISCVTVPANPKALVDQAKTLGIGETVMKALEAQVEAPVEEPTPPAEDAPAIDTAPEATIEPEAPAEGAAAPEEAGSEGEPATEPAPAPTEPAKSIEATATHTWSWEELNGQKVFETVPELKEALGFIRDQYQALEQRIEELRKELEAKTGQPVSAKEAVKVLSFRMGDLSRNELKRLDKSAGLRLRVLKTQAPDSQKDGGENT